MYTLTLLMQHPPSNHLLKNQTTMVGVSNKKIQCSSVVADPKIGLVKKLYFWPTFQYLMNTNLNPQRFRREKSIIQMTIALTLQNLLGFFNFGMLSWICIQILFQRHWFCLLKKDIKRDGLWMSLDLS